MKPVFYFFTLILLNSCSGQDSQASFSPTPNDNTSIDTTASHKASFDPPPYFEPINRQQIEQNIQSKIDAYKPLIAHVLVPLCDNENQGIVPTSKSLGDGLNLKTNLYWATGHGMKMYFVKQHNWEYIGSEMNPDTNILERCVFEKTYANGTKTILITDAYRGDRMRTCVEDYFTFLKGAKPDTLQIKGLKIPFKSNADLLGFNGHNGLMDGYPITTDYNQDSIHRDAAIIACYSESYFLEYLQQLKAYPLVTTTGLLYPVLLF